MNSRFAALFAKGIAVSFGMALYFGGSAHAATIDVTTTAVTGTVSDCTFSDAVEAANTNVVVNGCAAGDPEPTLDIINVPSGALLLNATFTFSESVDIRGAGTNLTTLTYFSFYSDAAPLSIAKLSFHNLTLNGGDLNVSNPLADLTIDHVRLDGVYISSDSYTDGRPLALNFTNVSAINDSLITIKQASDNPGDVLIENSVLTGIAPGSGITAVTYNNDRGNARLDIRNSVITGYTTGILNHECSEMVWGPNSIYITDSMIGGGGMTTGILNECGHLVINRTTFHDITGAAIMAWANYQSTNQNSGGCDPQSNSRLEVYNSTFSSITVSGSYTTTYPMFDAPYQGTLVTPFIGILTFDSQVNPTCPSGTQVTDTDITLVHNTFANNTFTAPGSAVLGITNNTVLHSFRVQNNAMQGRALFGNFSVSGGVTTVGKNLTTQPYSGPSAFTSAFLTVADFLLGPLQDNGGAATGVDLGSGRVLTMRPFFNSPLIDAAPFAGLAEDQRGTGRSLLTRYDAGSVEVTLAEYTADGGVYVPETTGRLAETGSDGLFMAELGASFVATGLYLVYRKARIRAS